MVAEQQSKAVFFFGDGKADGNASMKNKKTLILKDYVNNI